MCSGRAITKSIIAVALFLAKGSEACQGQPADSRPGPRRFPRQRLIVGVHEEYPRVPIQIWTVGEAPRGYAVSLLQTVTAPLGYDLEFVPTTDEGRWADLREGRIDLLPFASIPEARQPEVVYTLPILKTPGTILSRPGAPLVDGAAGLRGGRIGNTVSGVSATWMASLGLQATQTRADIEALLPLLRDGVVDYVPLTRFSGRIAMEETGIRGFRETVVTDFPFWRSFAIAVRQTDTGLLADLNDGIDALRRNGEFDRIHRKWLQKYEPLDAPSAIPLSIVAWVGGGLLLCGAVATAWHVTLRRELNRRTARLRASEEKYARLFEGCQEAAMVYLVQSGEIVEANQAACELYGFERPELIGRSIASLQSTDAGDTALRVVNAGRINWHQTRHQRKNGAPVEVEVNATRIMYNDVPAILTFNRDMTQRLREEAEKRRLEEEVQHAQRIESLGLLAGGIAHDFNNLLLTILGHTELAMLRAEDPARVRKKLGEIEHAATRAADLTKQLLAYAGKTGFQEETLSLTSLIREMLQLIGNRLNPHARIEVKLPDTLPAVRGDATMLRQMIMNLLINASDALGENGGSIRVTGTISHFDREALSGTFVAADIPAGRYVVLEIADTGKGMSEEILKRIFEPFFSTKFTGRGLGLAVALRTVQRHEGALKVRSMPGQGTAFQILLPPSAEAVDLAYAKVGVSGGDAGEAETAGWALVVDDTPEVRDVVRTMLESKGWTVTTATDGDGALEILRGAPGLRAVVLDLTMPGICGAPLVRALRETRPDIPILIVSGYSESAGAQRPGALQDEEFLAKPFTLADLMKGLASAMARRSQPTICR